VSHTDSTLNLSIDLLKAFVSSCFLQFYPLRPLGGDIQGSIRRFLAMLDGKAVPERLPAEMSKFADRVRLCFSNKALSVPVQAALAKLGKPQKKESGSVTGVLHRAWIDTKASLGGGDKTHSGVDRER
jgi:hypothetical protein